MAESLFINGYLQEAIEAELGIENHKLFRAWFWLLRWLVPVSIALILYRNL